MTKEGTDLQMLLGKSSDAVLLRKTIAFAAWLMESKAGLGRRVAWPALPD